MHCRCCKKDRLLCVITDNICHFAKLILERSDKRRQRTWKPGSATHNTISCKKQETWSLVHRGKSRKARICQKTKTEYSNSIRSYIIYKRRRKKKKKKYSVPWRDKQRQHQRRKENIYSWQILLLHSKGKTASGQHGIKFSKRKEQDYTSFANVSTC